MNLNLYYIFKLFWAVLCVGPLLVSCTNLPRKHPLNQLFPTPSQADKKWLSGTGTPKPPSALDVATSQERLAASQRVKLTSSKYLGSTIASLGNPAETGFWLKTPLVEKTQPGRIVSRETGKSVNVTLMPLETQGSGSQVSLSAMRLMGVSLIALPEINVFPL
jgi:hypothetical protein